MKSDSIKLKKISAYETMLKQADALFLTEEPVITALANLSALIFNRLEYVSWCGFYLAKNKRLYLGPFQGKVACEFIDFGKGVCGKAAEELKTIIVPDVHKFEGHIACDSETKSEIVIPVIDEGKLFGVLDLDSYDFGAFDKIDADYLKKIVEKMKKNVRLANYHLT